MSTRVIFLRFMSLNIGYLYQNSILWMIIIEMTWARYFNVCQGSSRRHAMLTAWQFYWSSITQPSCEFSVKVLHARLIWLLANLHLNKHTSLWLINIYTDGILKGCTTHHNLVIWATADNIKAKNMAGLEEQDQLDLSSDRQWGWAYLGWQSPCQNISRKCQVRDLSGDHAIYLIEECFKIDVESGLHMSKELTIPPHIHIVCSQSPLL